MPGIVQNLAANFFKGLIQNSTPKPKVEIQLYVDSENFIKKILSSMEVLPKLGGIAFFAVTCFFTWLRSHHIIPFDE